MLRRAARTGATLDVGFSQDSLHLPSEMSCTVFNPQEHPSGHLMLLGRHTPSLLLWRTPGKTQKPISSARSPQTPWLAKSAVYFRGMVVPLARRVQRPVARNTLRLPDIHSAHPEGPRDGHCKAMISETRPDAPAEAAHASRASRLPSCQYGNDRDRGCYTASGMPPITYCKVG